MSRSIREFGAVFLVSVLALTLALQIGGGTPEVVSPGIPDAGRFVGWALPLTKLGTDVAAVLVVGFLVAAVFLLPSSDDEVEGLSVQGVRLAARWATVWSVASLVLYVLTVSDTFARPLGTLSWALLWSLAADSSLGKAILLQAAAAGLVALAARWTFGTRPLAAILGLALATLAPVALTTHKESSGSHDLATTSLLLHVVAATLWIGGLAALCWVALRGSRRLEDAIGRYSVLAVWALVVVGVSGAINAVVELGSFGELFGSAYGQIVLAKLAALVALGLVGYAQRRRIAQRGSGFVRLAVTELLIMATAIGLAVALTRTPVSEDTETLTSPAELLYGGPLPPGPSLAHLVWGWSGSGIGLAIVGIGTALYARGVWSMRRRGNSWPLGRTLSWLGGMTVIAWATFGGLGAYSNALFSAHMAAHMLLSMVAPILLVLGAPMTLALRTLPGPRQPGEVSPRALLLAVLHSRFSQLVTHPLVGPMLFVGSLYGLYFTGAFQGLMSAEWGHGVMQLHFLTVGTIYYYVLIGVDPAPRQLAPIVRFGMLLVTIPFHAFFAIAVMSSSTVLAGDYWRGLDRPFRTDLLADQYLGGGIAWAMGEIPLLLVMGAILVQWFGSDSREAKRFDRSESRTNDSDLEAYNALLRDLAAHGKRRDP